LIPITKPALSWEEARAPVDSILSGWVTQGPKVQQFERAVADYVGAKHGIATTSATTALHFALVALGVGPDDEVIVPSFTFIASANAIRMAGAAPVFCEIDPRTFNIDPEDAERRVTERTAAIMPVDQIGLACDIDAIIRIGAGWLEDAAPAIGAACRDIKVGARGRAVFSFHPRKVITTGEGGMFMTDDDFVAARARRLRAHGMSVSDLERHETQAVETYDEVGFNYRMTDIQASIGIVQMQRLDDLLRIRREKAARYDRELVDIPWLRTPYVPPYATHTYQSYCVDLDPSVDREAVMRKLHEHGVATRRGVMATHLEKPYRSDLSLPITEAKAKSTMLIPLFPSMTDIDQTTVVEALHAAL